MRKILIAILAAIAFFGCGKGGPSVQQAQAAYERHRNSKGFCRGPVGAFRKVNGFERGIEGTNFYVIEFEAEEIRKSCWQDWETKGNNLLFGGEIYFINTEMGWQAKIIECGEKINGRWIVTGFCRSPL